MLPSAVDAYAQGVAPRGSGQSPGAGRRTGQGPTMRTTRAFIAGLGTTGSLVAAAICLLIVVGAVVAFNGWPGTGLADKVDRFVVDDSSQSSVPVSTSGPAAVAAGASTAAATVAPAPGVHR